MHCKANLVGRLSDELDADRGRLGRGLAGMPLLAKAGVMIGTAPRDRRRTTSAPSRSCTSSGCGSRIRPRPSVSTITGACGPGPSCRHHSLLVRGSRWSSHLGCRARRQWATPPAPPARSAMTSTWLMVSNRSVARHRPNQPKTVRLSG
jgi:hypothetical protein